MSYKQEVLSICAEVAKEFPDLEYQSGVFIKKIGTKCKISIKPSLYFTGGQDPCVQVNPSIVVTHSDVNKLAKLIDIPPTWVVLIRFDMTSDEYRTGNKSTSHFYKEKHKYWTQGFSTLPFLAEYLAMMIRDGQGFVDQYLDLSSEFNLLKNIPLGYIGRSPLLDRCFLERRNGVYICLAKMLVGDFEFVDDYVSGKIQTTLPKDQEYFEKLVAALPQLKENFAQTGSVLKSKK